MSDQQGFPFASVGVDVGALITVVATWEHLIPVVLGVLGGVWYTLEIIEWVVRWRERRRKDGGCNE